MKVLFGPTIMSLEYSLGDLREQFPDVEFEYCPAVDDLNRAVRDAEVFVGSMTEDLFKDAKRLKWIQSSSSGVDKYLSIPDLAAGDVLLTSASGTHGPGLAESTLGTMLAFNRGLLTSVYRQQARKWSASELRPVLIELTGMTLGILGFGAFGQHLAERAQAFGMNILAIDIRSRVKPDYVSQLWGPDRLDDLLSESDYVVVALPLTPETENLITADKIALMKPSAILLAMSRGGIVDQDAVARALREKRLRAAALEVMRPEPLPADSYLWDVENLLITSHIAGGTQYERQYVIEIFSDNLARLLAGNLPLRNQVDKGAGF
ncbi:MAG: D-2-hydroxyacid dehydrogenase [Chloroflexi bacterium]|nr:D-2-hydroxyacid dehydrogenase [Chloroflexota bacterium]